MTERTYALSPDCGEKFYNQADYCIAPAAWAWLCTRSITTS